MSQEKQIESLMKSLGCSREEALDIIQYDDDVNHDKPTEHDLSPEQQAVVKQMARQVDHKKGANVKRDRKPNELKEAIVAEIAEFLKEDAQGQLYEEVRIANPNRMVAFSVNGKKFELTLVEKRSPKAQ